jgi:hypothetical protein
VPKNVCSELLRRFWGDKVSKCPNNRIIFEREFESSRRHVTTGVPIRANQRPQKGHGKAQAGHTRMASAATSRNSFSVAPLAA